MTRIPRTGIVALALVAALGLAACGSDFEATASAASSATTHHSTEHTRAPAAERIHRAAFRQDMRKLWEDHITWTRLYIVSAVAGLPDVDATAGRLLQNQADIGSAMATFYGADAGQALTALLRDHILIAADLVAAAKAGDNAAVTAQSERWYANADDIARFLADANRAWPYGTLRQMMRTHLDQTLAEVTARLQQVRSELPPEAEPPVVEVQRADRPYASFYLSFTSTER
ncbi:MAG TPA: hypothetical protein VLD86_07490, partial [Ilumatobacteraceae bacterium]|nr:hypothetical protein [Ilumatobacteraceae bacterium]